MSKKSLLSFLVTLLGCLLASFASWLETNSLFYTSVSQHFSLFKMSLISSKTNATSVITFGLWRYCISNSIAFSCSPIQMNFDIDALAIMNNINQWDSSNDHQDLPSLTPISYVRLIPLLIATLLAVTALGSTTCLLLGNIKKLLTRKTLFWLTSLLCFICAILLSIAFGTTYHTYTTNITEACSFVDLEYTCSSYTLNTEIVLLAISIGIFMISTMYCIICSASQLTSSSKMQQQNNTASACSVDADYESPNETASIYNAKQDTPDSNTQLQRASLHPPPPNQQKRVKSRSSQAIPHTADWNADGVVPCLAQHQQPTATGATNVASTSVTCMVPDHVVLRPPTLPFASRANNQSKNRPSSYGSDNTFGALGGGNSAGTDDASSQVSSYMDYHQRADSGSSITHPPNNDLVYVTGSGTPSHHTLGGALSLNNLTKQPSSHSYYHNSSSEEDGLHTKRQFDDSCSSLCSDGHMNCNCTDTLVHNRDNTIVRRIDDYRHVVAQEKQ